MIDRTEIGQFDVDARMEEIVGKPPRIAPLDRQTLSAEQLSLIRGLRTSAGVSGEGVVPEFCLIALKHPAVFGCQMQMGVLLFKGAISPRERQLAVLRTAWLCGAPYEWGEHVSISQRCSVTSDEVERATQGSSAPGWSAHDAAILRGVEELLSDRTLSEQTWNTLAESWTEPQLLEFPILVGVYFTTAIQQNSLRIPLEPGNPGLKRR